MEIKGEIKTKAVLNTDTMEVSAEFVDTDGLDLDMLENEYFIAEDGSEYEICPECHEYALKFEMVEGVGKQLYETKICNGCGFGDGI